MQEARQEKNVGVVFHAHDMVKETRYSQLVNIMELLEHYLD